MTTQNARALGFFPSSGELKVVDLPVGALEPDEVLVRVLRVALTRRDRQVLSGARVALPDGSDFIVPGHVAVGKVVEVGSLARAFRAGDTVVPTIRRDCNRCIDARSDLCPHPDRYRDAGLAGEHGFAREFLKVKARYLVHVPREIEEVALLLTPLSMAEKAHAEVVGIDRRFNFYCYHEPERVAPRALVTGMGPVGIMTVFLLSLYGYRLTVFCRRESDDVRSSLFSDLDLEYLNISRVPLERLEKAGYTFRHLFETTGDPSLVLGVMPFMASNAVMVLMGLPESGARDARIPVEASHLISRMVMGNQVLLGSIKAGRDAFDSAVKHLTELHDLHPSQLQGMMGVSAPLAEARRLLELGTREAVLPILEVA